MKTLLKLAFSLLPLFAMAQKPLEVGDQMPDWKFSPLLNGEGDRTLSSDKANGLMLCFWYSTCGASLGMLTKASALEKDFPPFRSVFISMDKDSAAPARVLKRRPSLETLKIPLMKRDTALLQLFPHTSGPHIVLIGPDRRIKAITSGGNVNRQTVTALLEGKDLNLPVKKPYLFYSEQTTLLGDGLVDNANLLFSTTITGAIEQLPPGLAWNKVGGNRDRVLIANTTLEDLYLYAYEDELDATLYQKPKHLLMEEARGQGTSGEKGKEPEKYCYERLLPGGARKNFAGLLRADLDSYFGYTSGIEAKVMDCWILRPLPGRPQKGDGKGRYSQDWPDYVEMRNAPLRAIAARLNRGWPGKIILAEENNKEVFTVNINHLYASEEELQKDLEEKGFELVPVRKEMKMIVVRKKKDR